MTCRIRRFVLALTVVTATISPVNATQTGSTSASSDIVVTAPSVEAKKQLTEAVRALTVRSGDDASQVARFQDTICPLVIGIRDDVAPILADRIRENASAAGLGVRPAGCEANVIVVIDTSAPKVIESFKKLYPDAIYSLSQLQLDRLAAQTGPVRYWSLVRERGSESSHDPNGPQRYGASIFASHTRQDMVASFVVLESAPLLGKTVRQIADYVTMVALARIRPGKAPTNRESILALFEKDTPPKAMTSFDTAYLKALYRQKGNETYNAVTRHVTDAIIKTDSGSNTESAAKE